MTSQTLKGNKKIEGLLELANKYEDYGRLAIPVDRAALAMAKECRKLYTEMKSYDKHT